MHNKSGGLCRNLPKLISTKYLPVVRVMSAKSSVKNRANMTTKLRRTTVNSTTPQLSFPDCSVSGSISAGLLQKIAASADEQLPYPSVKFLVRRSTFQRKIAKENLGKELVLC